jgi:hypothetical protein
VKPDPPSGDNAARLREEVARRVRRAVGFKVMRDLHGEARAIEEERRQRPRLVLRLTVLIVMLAAAGLAALWVWYR